jgi:protein-S-isoprenylcysteine O-methyltransferase Ste14
VLLLASVAVNGYRIHGEEALVENFGEEYRAYMEETMMLVPFVR